jgi:hypothetical protein
MQNISKPNSISEAETELDDSTLDNSTIDPTSPQVPVRGYPGKKSEGTTVKNPKDVETTKETKVEQVANKAAHKAAKDEQEQDKKNSIISI